MNNKDYEVFYYEAHIALRVKKSLVKHKDESITSDIEDLVQEALLNVGLNPATSSYEIDYEVKDKSENLSQKELFDTLPYGTNFVVLMSEDGDIFQAVGENRAALDSDYDKLIEYGIVNEYDLFTGTNLEELSLSVPASIKNTEELYDFLDN